MIVVRRGLRPALIGMCVAGAMLAAACGGGGGGGDSGGNGNQPVKIENVNKQGATPTPDTNRPEVVIEVHDNAFVPETVTVSRAPGSSGSGSIP